METKQKSIKKTKELTTIDNGLVETLFLADASDDEVQRYYTLMDIPIRGHGLATSYASRIVARKFLNMLHDKTGLDYSDLLYRRK